LSHKHPKEHDVLSEAMHLAIVTAHRTMNENAGGPFGAAVITADGQIISVTSNTVLRDHDPTAHAEINAIRKATIELSTHDLSGCTLVTTAYPCPMCLGATIWANIKTVVYGCRPEDADAIGFRDDMIYDVIRNPEKTAGILHTEEKFRDECLTLFQEYDAKSKTIY
jgi:guanine deaminase